MEAWLKKHRVTEVECLMADISGVARGKILPAKKFVEGVHTEGLRLPVSIFGQTVTGDWPETGTVLDPTEPDMYLRPDPSTIRLVPWYEEPTAEVIADCFNGDGTPVSVAPRAVLRRVLELYKDKGWTPVVAPELEFFLVAKNTDPDYPLEPPVGRSGRAESGRQSFGIDAVNEFDPIVDDIYDFCEVQRIDIDTLTHEAGRAQLEINFRHGDALDVADQAFLFKRTVRQAAMRHGIYATFMAKPIEGEPGSAMHIHQSVLDDDGRNIFDDNGAYAPLFLSHIAGLQKFLPATMPLLAPNVNSYRRLQRDWAAPINVHWAPENRTVGLRVPTSAPVERRIENRIPGADVNPYLAIAASLACGYLGMVRRLSPTRPTRGDAYAKPFNLPRYLPDALPPFIRSKPLREILGGDFVELVRITKQAEHDAYQRVVSSWEREHLLLNI